MILDGLIGFLIVVVLGIIGACVKWIWWKFNHDLETLIKDNDSLSFKEAWAKNQLKVYFFGEGEMPLYRMIYVLFIYLILILFILLLLLLSIYKIISI